MKKNLLFTGALSAMLMASQLSLAQITCFKLENGNKTPLKEGEKFEITVNKDQQIETNSNIMVELDLVAFKKKYNYDNFRIRLRFVDNEYSYSYNLGKAWVSASEYIKFSDPFFLKKYANLKTLQFYLIKTDETTTANSFSLIKSMSFDPTLAKENFQLIVEGGYVKGEEEYYDKDSKSWKKKDILSDFERIKLISDAKFKLSDELILKENYKKLVNPGDRRILDESGNLIRGVGSMDYSLRNQSKSLEKSHKEISQAITSVSDYMQKKIMEEPDNKKAVALVIEWNKKALPLIVESINPSELKALKKELKSVTEPEAILEIFKKHNPNPQWPK